MSPPHDTSRPKARPGIAERIIDGEALLVNAEGGEILVLNECGALVWQLCDGAHDVPSLVAAVCGRHEVEPETATADVVAFLEELRRRGALET